ncbi:nuclear factor erythroid 2-related factor 2a [Austrofundulus limnaeus]|uniref:Nuclear factor erythroid 2-related factor 2a n=1 Tax=Austrofundulus limnaeus TaxID=52670 RepID=A0A2I4AMY0_AUSLI|nr:PREDICTED: nuclear factor erythroid 2-related factor 2 [Austrofundulus limnaeus]
MMMDMEVMHSNQQDMDLIDILWKQDIDLGARREVFDYNHRQKEYELQRQRELEEEKKLHLLREQEKALLAQLQLDEETGEYIPRPPPSAPLQPTGTSLEVTQNVSFTETGDSMSFDECLQLLAETFPVEGTENASVCMDTPATHSNIMMSPEQPALSPADLPSAQLALPQRMTPDLEQAWMELWSLPELQQCLNMPMKDTMETTSYPLSNNPEVQSPSYPNYLQMQTLIFNPMTTVSDVKTNSLNVPTEFMNTFEGSVPSVAPSHNFREVKPEASQLNSSFSADVFYLNTELEESSGQPSPDIIESTSDASNKPTYTSMDLYSLSPGESFDKSKQNLTEEHPDSDSGISIQGSPNSPSKSAYGGESFRYDSEMEDMDHSPGSAESEYSEIFPLNYQLDNPESEVPASSTGEPEQEKKPKQHTVDPAEKSGHSGAPFTKDKPKRRSDVRLSRDEQKAKTLKIPFTVDMIINLPVDDFNELMSKHQLNEAQLALVRDIRRRGKNKVAAQNCRKRKMENIVGLEGELDSLNEEKERLLKEKSKNMTDLKEMKQQLTSLYQEVFSLLRDEQGNSYSPLEYSLQQSTDGSVFLVPRIKKTFRSEDNHLSPL